jgi:hypothetical protein
MVRPTVLALLAVFAALAAGCGDSEDASPAPDARALADLRRALVQGRGMADPKWPDVVQTSAQAIWPDPVHGPAARKRHTELAHFAGDLAREFAHSPEARADWTARDPESVEIHDGFLAATGASPDEFRAWVTEVGAGLLAGRMERLAGERPPR